MCQFLRPRRETGWSTFYKLRITNTTRKAKPANMEIPCYPFSADGTAAAAEFQKLLNHRGVIVNFVTGTLAHLQVGRAYAMTNDNAKAKAAYNDFLTLWKDADPDFTILEEANAESSKLK